MFVVDMNGSPEVFTLNIIKLFIFIPFTELSSNSYWTATFLPVTLGSGVLVCWSNRKWYHSIGTTRRRRGGQGDPNLSPPYFEFLAHIPFFFASSLKPFFNWKYYALLHNFPLFLPLPTLLELPPTALSSPLPYPSCHLLLWAPTPLSSLKLLGHFTIIFKQQRGSVLKVPVVKRNDEGDKAIWLKITLEWNNHFIWDKVLILFNIILPALNGLQLS